MMRFLPIGKGYFVGTDGTVLSPSGRTLKPRAHTNGYCRVNLPWGRDQYIHRVVCTAFHGHPLRPDDEVDHINRDRADNRPENLRWVNKSENLAHRRNAHGSAHAHAKLTEADVIALRRGHLSHLENRKAASLLGVARETVRDIRNGKQWRHVQ